MSEEISGGMENGAEVDSGADTGEALEAREGQEKKKPAAPPLKKPVPKMRQVKVNGKVEFIDEDQVFRDYQKYRAGEERLRTAAQKEAEIERLRRQIEEDPETVLKSLPNFNTKKRELAERLLEEALAEELGEPIDERDKELADLKAWKQQVEEEKKAAEEKKKQEEQQKFVEARKTALSTTLAEAMKDSMLGDHPESAAATLREMAVYMRAARERGEDVTPQELVQHIHNNRFHQMYTLAHQYDGDDLIQFLGEEIVNRIRRADIERIKRQRQTPVETYRNTDAPVRKGNSRFIDPADEKLSWRFNG